MSLSAIVSAITAEPTIFAGVMLSILIVLLVVADRKALKRRAELEELFRDPASGSGS